MVEVKFQAANANMQSMDILFTEQYHNPLKEKIAKSPEGELMSDSRERTCNTTSINDGQAIPPQF